MARNSDRFGEPAESWMDKTHITQAVNDARYGQEVDDMEAFLR